MYARRLWRRLLQMAMLLACLLITLIIDGPDSILSLSPLFLCASGLLGLFYNKGYNCPTLATHVVWPCEERTSDSARHPHPAAHRYTVDHLDAFRYSPSDDRCRASTPSSALFLPAVCAVCALISVVTWFVMDYHRHHWVAFMGIGTIMGFSAPWVAGAIISGAYFGDKISPLSDTTVLALIDGQC